jgi:hypothetical protein
MRVDTGNVLLSKLYRQMYAGTGISTDSARRKRAKTSARWIARQTRKVFRATPMPELIYPVWGSRSTRPTELTATSVIKISDTSDTSVA